MTEKRGEARARLHRQSSLFSHLHIEDCMMQWTRARARTHIKLVPSRLMDYRVVAVTNHREPVEMI